MSPGIDAKERLPYNVLYYGFFCVVIILCGFQLFVGYADNGDFLRSIAFVLEKPYGLAMWSTADSAEYEIRFFHQWHDKWIYLESGPTLHLATLSTYKLYLLLQAVFCKIILLDIKYYSIIAGSLLTRLIYFALYGMLFYEIRNKYTRAVSSMFIVMSCAIILDVNFSAMFNTFYEEQIAIIFMPMVLLLFIKYYSKPSLLVALMIIGSAAFIGAAKTSLFYLPLLIAPFVVTVIKNRKEVVYVCLAIIMAQGMAVLPVVYGKYGKVNQYNALYVGALRTVDSTEAVAIARIGDKTVYYECVGEEPFNNPKGKACMEKVNATYGDVVRLVVSHPSIGFRIIAKILSEGRNIDITFLGKNIHGCADYSKIFIYNLTAISFRYLYGIIMATIAVLSLATGVMIMRGRPGCRDAMMRIGLFLAFFGLTQYIVTIADGFRDLSKHLLVGNYSFGLSFVMFVSGIVVYRRNVR